MLGIEISYLACLLCVTLRRVVGSLRYPIDGIDATHSSHSSGSPSMPFRHPSRIDVVDMLVQPPLTVNKTSHGSSGEDVKVPSTPRNILNVDSE
jgi:hypothetical protein